MRETGFTHVVLNTAYPLQLSGFFSALGWQIQQMPTTEDTSAFWGVETAGELTRCVAPTGTCEVLLLPMPPDVPPLRPMDCPVTTPGGLFDVNMRTWDSEWARTFLQQHGWRELVPAVAWQFGEVETSEGLYIQDDGIVMAVMQRLHPPLEGIEFDRMSDIFNSTQMVRDVEQTLAFLQLLGFERFIHHAGPLPGDGPKVLQLEAHPVESSSIHLSIAHPRAVMSGSIELIDVPQHPLPLLDVPVSGGRGIRALCIPCDDIDAAFTAIDTSEWAANVCQPLQDRQLPGCLDGHSFSVMAPDGGRLDLYQR